METIPGKLLECSTMVPGGGKIPLEMETKTIDITNLENEITGSDNGMEFGARRDRDKVSQRRACFEKTRIVVWP